ncbi:MAG: hypothetical protein F2663_05395 [Actinobacteria bacterium]|nr:hypothetical protein [Actinomycetota bacterium]
MTSRVRNVLAFASCAVAAVARFAASSQFATPASARAQAPIPYTAVVNDSGILLLTGSGTPVPSSGITSAPAAVTVINRGTGSHALSITGPGVSGKHTPTLTKGHSSRLSVTFMVGTYALTDTLSHRSLKLVVRAPKSAEVAVSGKTHDAITEEIECSLDTHLCTNAQGVVVNPGSA